MSERPDIPMRIEAAAARGKPVYFELIGPWTRAERLQPYQPTSTERASLAISGVFFLSVWVGGALAARRNIRLGRGDRRGASRLAAFVFAAQMVRWFFSAHHVPSLWEGELFAEFLARGLVVSCFIWLLYIALEPYVRHRWPVTLVSWSRLLAGSFRDPLVGRDVLAGCFLNSSYCALDGLGWFVPLWLGSSPSRPRGPSDFLDARTALANLADALIGAPFTWLAILFVLVLLRALLRKEWAAAASLGVIMTLLTAPGRDPVSRVLTLAFFVLGAFVLMRFGLLAPVAGRIIFSVFTTFPLTTQESAWYAGISLAGILVMTTLVFYGFYTSLGGRPVFGGAVLEE